MIYNFLRRILENVPPVANHGRYEYFTLRQNDMFV